MSKNNLMGELARILIDHGMQVEYDNFFYRDKNIDVNELHKSIGKIDRQVQAQKAEDISKTEDIDEAQFQKLDKKETNTKQEKQQVAKHFFQKVYGLSDFTPEAYIELSPLISKYSRLKMTKIKEFDNFVETYLHFESDIKSDCSIDQVHRSKKFLKYSME